MHEQHSEHIRDQFTKQAVPFAAALEIRNEDVLRRIVEMAHAGPTDTVLDVACGPGLLALAFARVTRHVTGIDVTPKMLEQAFALQRQHALDNLTWHLGEVPPLPYRDREFSIVSTRFSFHHFLDPLEVLKEMRRVCCPGGRVVVVDSAPARENADAFNRMERLRDPSHVRAFPPEDLLALFAAAELPAPVTRCDLMSYELETFLGRSFPKEGDADRVRHMFEESTEADVLGLSPTRREGRIYFSLPVLTVVSTVPS